MNDPGKGGSAKRTHRRLTILDPFGRSVDNSFIRREVERGAWRPTVVPPEVSGVGRAMTILLATRKTDLIKWAWHGDEETFCPPTWADLAIGSG